MAGSAFVVDARRVEGVIVSDEDSAVIPYASLYLRQARSGYTADKSGCFSIEAADSDTLRVSAVGYRPVLKPISQFPNAQPDTLILKREVIDDEGIHISDINESEADKDNNIEDDGIVMTQVESTLPFVDDTMRQIPVVYWAEKLVLAFSEGYWKPTKTSPVAIGPLTTLLGYNAPEGIRARIGGITTSSLSPHLFGRGYVAYGFRDRKWKYDAELEYSFNRKRFFAKEFPVHSIRLEHRYDIEMYGQRFIFDDPDNVYLSLTLGKNNLASYLRSSLIEYKLELTSRLSFLLGTRYYTHESTRWAPFTYADGTSIGQYSQGYFQVKVRYAPQERYFQTPVSRTMRWGDAPAVEIMHEYGPKGLLGSLFTVNQTVATFKRRYQIPYAGDLYCFMRGGKMWSQVQFPALPWPRAQVAILISPETFQLMSPMEFAQDWYASADFALVGKGYAFNWIPGVKLLQMRELFTLKGIYGGLTRKNNPEYNTNLFRFPEQAHIHTYGRRPYMEIGTGIDNILGVLRLDFVWRLTYRDCPDVDRFGVRVGLFFTY